MWRTRLTLLGGQLNEDDLTPSFVRFCCSLYRMYYVCLYTIIHSQESTHMTLSDMLKWDQPHVTLFMLIHGNNRIFPFEEFI